MRDIVKEYQKKFRRNHQRARRYTALLLALALTTSLFVNWQLHGVGICQNGRISVRRAGARAHRCLL